MVFCSFFSFAYMSSTGHVQRSVSHPSQNRKPSWKKVRFATMERQHNALSDELWGDELSLAKVGCHKTQKRTDFFGCWDARFLSSQMISLLLDDECLAKEWLICMPYLQWGTEQAWRRITRDQYWSPVWVLDVHAMWIASFFCQPFSGQWQLPGYQGSEKLQTTPNIDQKKKVGVGDFWLKWLLLVLAKMQILALVAVEYFRWQVAGELKKTNATFGKLEDKHAASCFSAQTRQAAKIHLTREFVCTISIYFNPFHEYILILLQQFTGLCLKKDREMAVWRMQWLPCKMAKRKLCSWRNWEQM